MDTREHPPTISTTVPLEVRTFPRVAPPLLDLTYQERMYLMELQNHGQVMSYYLTAFELRLLAAKILSLG